MILNNNCKIQLFNKIKFMKIKNLAQIIKSKAASLTTFPSRKIIISTHHHYKPTLYLAHPFLQSVFNISQPKFPFKFEREKIFFDDGGHISLDWLSSKENSINPPILFVMHGLTGGSQMNYIKQLVKPANEQGYCCVCLNSRGINNEMTSPIPFTAMGFVQIESALERITSHYPQSDIYMVGTSFGGNYLLRYLIRGQPKFNIKGLVALATPLNVGQVVSDMGSVYQKFFVKRYIQETITRHKQMQFWENIGLVNMKDVKGSQNLMQFHTNFTAKILGYNSAKQIFDQYTITDAQLRSLNMKTLMMVSKDDPIVSYTSMPFDSINNNSNIQFRSTDRGGHLCWFQGFKPKRWYPKPVLQYLRTLRNSQTL